MRRLFSAERNMRRLSNVVLGTALIGMLCLLIVTATASPLVYTPVNPAFGGNPMNGQILLNTAQAINKFKDPSLDMNKKTSAQRFNETLQRSIISRLSFTAASGMVDANGNLVDTGTTGIQTSDFTITIANLNGTGEMVVNVEDKATGDLTTFSVCQPSSVLGANSACVP